MAFLVQSADYVNGRHNKNFYKNGRNYLQNLFADVLLSSVKVQPTARTQGRKEKTLNKGKERYTETPMVERLYMNKITRFSRNFQCVFYGKYYLCALCVFAVLMITYHQGEENDNAKIT
jgi:hypothetical protein